MVSFFGKGGQKECPKGSKSENDHRLYSENHVHLWSFLIFSATVPCKTFLAISFVLRLNRFWGDSSASVVNFSNTTVLREMIISKSNYPSCLEIRPFIVFLIVLGNMPSGCLQNRSFLHCTVVVTKTILTPTVERQSILLSSCPHISMLFVRFYDTTVQCKIDLFCKQPLGISPRTIKVAES